MCHCPVNGSLLSLPCPVVPTHRSRCARGLLWFRLRTVGSEVSVVEQRQVATGQQSENGRYFKHGVVSWELSDNGRYFERSIAWCIALVQVQDADGL